MFQIGTGDHAQSLMLRRTGSSLRQTVSRLTAELASGQNSDKPRALGGNLLELANVEHGLALSAQHATSARLAVTFLEAQQNVADQIGMITERVSLDLRTSAQASGKLAMADAGERAKAGFEDAIGLLGTKIAGRHVFSGVAADHRPFAAPGDILGAVAASVPPNASPADIENHVTAWFAEGGPFDSVAYAGADAAANAIALGDGNSVRFDVTGADKGTRDSLAGLALGALAHTLAPGLDLSDMRNLLSAGADTLSASAESRIAMQARIGAQEARAADGLARAEARAASLQIIQSELLEADPYETATALESATQKLDALYLVTARLSRLSLTEYLR